jgi:general secretion pathway protein G
LIPSFGFAKHFMESAVPKNRRSRKAHGFSLVELIVATTILIILTSLAIPLARVAIKREKERDLRRDLWEMRDAIDRYKDAADRGAFQIKVGSEGYPPDLDTLVKGVDVQGKKLKFLRRIPIDPMTGTTEWGMRSMQDDADSDSWGGQNVFDVFTKSQGTALDGTKYKDW